MLRIPSKVQLPLRPHRDRHERRLLFLLIWRTGPSKLWKSLSELGVGIILVIAWPESLHLARTWGWRLTLGADQHKVSFSRLVGLKLGAEAAGQLGILGQTLGDSVRVSRIECGNTRCEWSRLGDSRSRPLCRNWDSDHRRGILAALPLVALSPRSATVRGSVRLYADRLSDGDVVRGAKALASAFVERPYHEPCSLPQELDGKEILASQSVESALFDFHHKTSGAFCASFL